jgi:hypothetical protein
MPRVAARFLIALCLCLSAAAAPRALVGADANDDTPRTRSVLDELGYDANTPPEKTPDGIRIVEKPKRAPAVRTQREFKTPLVITAVAKTDSTNIRLYYGKSGVIIFNWELNQGQLRHHDPKSGAISGVGDRGSVPKNTWVAIRWVISNTESRIEVDGVERASFMGDYSGLSGTVGIGPGVGSVVTVNSMTVSPIVAGGAARQPASPPVGPIDIIVPAAKPKFVATTQSLATTPAGDPNVIERPEFQNIPKRLVKSVTSVTSMMVTIARDGQESGFTSDIIATIPAKSRAGNTAGAGFLRDDADITMRVAFEEAARAVQLRYPLWEPGHIDFSFGDKFVAHGGPSAGTAFGLLMLSCLEGWDIDPRCAVTGDITVDWKVRKVGGVTAKLRGATLDKCLYAAIPEGNEAAFADMALLYSKSALWDIQVFSIATLQQAIALARTDRSPQLLEAMKLFDDLRPQLHKAEAITLHKPETRETLKRILQLAPNHLSAKCTLALCENTAPRTLSESGSLYQLSILFYPYGELLSSGERIDRSVLPVHITALARKRIAALRPIAHKDIQPMIGDVAAFIEALDAFAAKPDTASNVITRFQNLQTRFATTFNDPAFFEKIVREGY